MRFEVLGAIRAWRDGVELDLGATQQRMLLAVLLAHAGRPVPLGMLIDLLWHEDAPPSATNLIHRYVGNLRRVFEPGLAPRGSGRWLLRRSGGYQLDVDDDSLDLLRFRSLAEHARKAARDEPDGDHTPLFVEALALWHGRCSDATHVLGNTALFAAVDAEYTGLLRDAAD